MKHLCAAAFLLTSLTVLNAHEGQSREEASFPGSVKTSHEGSYGDPGAAGSSTETLSLRIDHEGAAALLAVLGQPTVDDADIDKLLAIPGVQAMVDNTTKYVPDHTREVFRSAVKEFVATGRSTSGPDFRLEESYRSASDIKAVVQSLGSDADLGSKLIGPLAGFLPQIGPLAVTVYSVAGGVSDGFVLDRTEPAFYVALNGAEGDADGVKLNMVHELYHVGQKMARARVPGLSARISEPGIAPDPVRLLTLVLDEGSATHVAAPMLAHGSGPYIDMWRGAYLKNAPPEKIRANFAEFDTALAGLHNGTMDWDHVFRMFSGTGPALYFVGYEMTKAIHFRYGRARIAALMQRHPAAFFSTYIDLYRACPSCAPATFSLATEAYIASLQTE